MKHYVWIACVLLLVAPTASLCTTYYVDFAAGSDSNNGTSKATPWLHAPGMPGFSAAYTHAAGDQFIFKGGTQCGSSGSPCWTSPWIISNSGASGTPDYYGVDKTWYEGAVWTPPVIDGGSQNPVASGVMNGYIKVTGSYVTLDSLQVQNIGVSGTNQGNYAVVFDSGHDLRVQNMVLPVQSRIALYYHDGSGTTKNNFTFVGNNISSCSWGIAVATTAPNTVLNNVVIHHNEIHDFHSQLANNVHGDGIFIYAGGSTTDYTQYVQNSYIYSNHFYGDFSKIDTSAAGMTAFVYFSQAAGPAYIYNNHGYDTTSTSGYIFEFGYMSGYPNGNVYVYNNSFAMDSSGGWNGFVSASKVPSLTIENNLYTGGQSVFYFGDTTTTSGLASDYNDFYHWALNQFANLVGSAGSITYSQFKALGYEAHGLNTDPLFVSSTDQHIESASPAIGAGTNLSSVFTTDADGNPLPASGAWTMGADQSSTASARLNPPTNLRVASVQ